MGFSLNSFVVTIKYYGSSKYSVIPRGEKHFQLYLIVIFDLIAFNSDIERRK